MKSTQKQHIHHIIFICLLMVVGWGQECDEGYTDINGECYYQSDLDVLQDFIDLNESLNDEQPFEIGNQDWNNTRLTYLGLGNRSLTTIPENIGNLNQLEYLFLSSNQLSILPESIGNLSSLKYLFLSHNQLTILPESIGNLSSLETLQLHYNQLNILPETICNLPQNSNIYFEFNQLCPPNPECLIENGWLFGYQDTSECEEPLMCDEEGVDLGWGDCNEWTSTFHSNGCMDSGCYSIEETTYIDLSDMNPGQVVLGVIPPEIGQLINLTILKLHTNEITGNIPSEIGNLVNLGELSLGGNQLTGEIPSEIGNLNNLWYFDVGGNGLTGEVPVEIYNLTNLRFLFYNFNNLTGTLSPNIGQLTELDNFFINDNQMSGQIPDTICDVNWNNVFFDTNSFCPPYPECIPVNLIGYQDTTNCPPLSISEQTLPTQYTLNQPFPNPFNPTTSISFSIPEQSQTSLKVYDIKGNMISTLLNQSLNVGHHQIEWNGENLSSGTYFIRINSGEFSDVKKVVLVK